MPLQLQKTQPVPDSKTAAANDRSSAGIALPAVSPFQFSKKEGAQIASASAVQMKATSGAVVQLQVNNAVAQRYPVEVDPGKTFVVLTNGRPAKRTTKPVQEAIIDDIFTYGAMNAHEKKLEALGKVKALYELRSNNWLSTNNCAICHKNSIDDVENTLVNFANKSATVKVNMYAQMENWIKILTTRDITAQVMGIAFLKNILDSATNATATKTSAEICVDAVNNLIELIDASSSNYYIGDAGTNSSIQSKPDPHYNNFATTTEAPPTPISKGLYDARVGIESVGGLGHLSPVRAKDSTGDWIKNSGAGDVNGHGWSVVDLSKGNV
ncbi:hypothetical protein [Chitinophaga sp. S165]|uniref:hypothetical protein n=1 Tax=Chitinophaga sp. S165 TaxID=2135462 RepID=UPI000D715291|nr:hypothetical protein [Chitinophaga sp. S165]PWV47557.1 hypothetical protein C7475_108124 [Chitinophaga sp. S165]